MSPAVLATIDQWIDQAVAQTAVCDLHTHIYPPNFGPLMLWGIDELVTYHYLVAETMRVSDMPYEKFWSLGKHQQADHIWKKLFVERAPIGEACRGVLTVLKRLGLDTAAGSLADYRAWYRDHTPEAICDKIFKVSNVKTAVMTNDPFEEVERKVWLAGPRREDRFKAVLRIDPLLGGWPQVAQTLKAMGYSANADLGGDSMKELRRFLTDWAKRMDAWYMACSLTPDWRYPDSTPATKVTDEAILPVCRELNLPFAVMIGVRRQVNPQLRLAGDAVGKSDIASLDRLCAHNPANKFLCTMLARENQHELAVSARKHRNLLIFGCWWFLNNPVLIEEITRMRMELLGTSFVPQHSDARILDQIVYKWDHSRAIIGRVLRDKFRDLAATGWTVTKHQVEQTVEGMLGGNFLRFIGR